MLKLEFPSSIELFDEVNNEFISFKPQTLMLEHSLISLSKWESKWEKAFMLKGSKTKEETLDYVRCMTITQNVDPRLYYQLTNQQLDQIAQYIEAPMTATTFRKENNKISREIITSERLYYYMIAYKIPFECQKWHLNRLFTLIQVCNIENQPKKNANPQEVMARNRALNEARRKEFNSKG